METRAQSLKQELIELGRDQYLLEKDLLYPDEKRLEIFLSVDVGQFFSITGVELIVDGKSIVTKNYFGIEADGFKKGAIQRIYIGNLDEGSHELKLFFQGKGARDRQYKRGLVHRFEKKRDPALIEVRIQDDERHLQPEFLVKEWRG